MAWHLLPKASTVGPGISLFARLSKVGRIIMFIFIMSILVTAVVMSVNAKDVNVGVRYLGNKTLLVTQNLNEQSLSVIENQGLYEKGDSFFQNTKNFLNSIWGFVIAVLLIFVWIRVLAWIFLHLVLMDDSKKSPSYSLAILFFFGTQMLFIALFTEDSIMTPINAFINFAKSLPFIFSPISEMVVKIKGI